MEVIFYEERAKFVGMLCKEDGYAIERKKKGNKVGYYSVRKAAYRGYSDRKHAAFLLKIARLALNNGNAMIKDIRVPVREFVSAHASLVCGWPLERLESKLRKQALLVWCNTLRLQLRKVKPSSVLNASDIIKLKHHLGE